MSLDPKDAWFVSADFGNGKWVGPKHEATSCVQKSELIPLCMTVVTRADIALWGCEMAPHRLASVHFIRISVHPSASKDLRSQPCLAGDFGRAL